MVLVSGSETKVAFVQAVVWETPVAVGAGSVQPVLTEDLSSEIELIEDLSLTGLPVQPLGGRGNEVSEGPLEFNASYDDRWIAWLAMILGNYEMAANVSGPNADFRDHLFTVLLSVAGKFGTLAIGRGSLNVDEFANAKPSELEFTTTGTEPLLQGTQQFINRKRNRNFPATPGAVNTPAVLAAATRIAPVAPIETVLAVFSHLTCGLRNDLDTAYDAVCLSELSSLRVARPQEGDFTTCLQGTIGEPVSVDFVELGGSFVIPNYSDDAVLQRFLTLNDSKSPRAFYLRWETPQTFDPNPPDPPLPLSIEFVFPAVQFTTEGPNASGPGKMPVTINFAAKRKAVPAAVVDDSEGNPIPTVNAIVPDGVFIRITNGRTIAYMT